MKHHRQGDSQAAEEKQWSEEAHMQALASRRRGGHGCSLNSALQGPPALHALSKKVEQRQFHRLIALEQLAADATPLTKLTEPITMGLKSLKVLFACSAGVDEQGTTRFKVLEHGCAVKIKRRFSRVEHL